MNKSSKSVATLACPAPLAPGDIVLLGHGSGGQLTSELVRDLFLPAFHNAALARLDDQAIVSVNGCRLAFTTDSFVVKPLFFPGGDIGSLAVHGTVNDLAMGGAQPLFLSAAFIIEEGFSMQELRRVTASLRQAAKEAGVEVVTGDTKVVERGSGDGLFINTSGIGLVPPGVTLSANQAQPGDQVLLSGPIGEHGMAIMAQREGLEFESAIHSDSAALHGLVHEMLKVTGAIRCMRDPTRGGLASALHEMAAKSKVGVVIEEQALPLSDAVRAASELTGIDPLHVANEGKAVLGVPAQDADKVLAALRAHPQGRAAAVVGTVVADHPGRLVLDTGFGKRLLAEPEGEPLPRIC